VRLLSLTPRWIDAATPRLYYGGRLGCGGGGREGRGALALWPRRDFREDFGGGLKL
jgi:hypothetical protein